jgi:hypothetical protein
LNLAAICLSFFLRSWDIKKEKRGNTPERKGRVPMENVEEVKRKSKRKEKRDDVEAYIGKCRREGKTEKPTETKTKKARSGKDEIKSPERKHTAEDKTHSQELPHIGGVCRKCLKKTDGKIDYLTNGLCRSCSRTR